MVPITFRVASDSVSSSCASCSTSPATVTVSCGRRRNYFAAHDSRGWGAEATATAAVLMTIAATRVFCSARPYSMCKTL